MGRTSAHYIFLKNLEKSVTIIENCIGGEKMEWIITAKVTGKEGYDILRAFEELEYIDWHKSKVLKNIKVGDIVYIYVGKPYSKIMLKMECIAVDIPEEKQVYD